MIMQYTNEVASIQTFVGNNPDIQHSNTLDLHGLQVKEALKALKEVMTEKKIGKIFGGKCLLKYCQLYNSHFHCFKRTTVS